VAARREAALRWIVAWAVASALFPLFWVVYDSSMWLAPLFGVAAASSLVASRAGRLSRYLRLHSIVLALWVVVSNLWFFAIPGSRLSTNAQLAHARQLMDAVTDADLIVSGGWDWSHIYVRYFWDRRPFSITDRYLDLGRNKAAFFSELDRDVAAAWRRGGRAVVWGFFDESPETWRYFFEGKMGLTRRDFARYRPQPTATEIAGQRVWLLHPPGTPPSGGGWGNRLTVRRWTPGPLLVGWPPPLCGSASLTRR
jgi:hypothetical protein